ncbi:hypothetical protein BST85_00725 [Aureitalea marina]|uniref:Uncharacterized protein n=2 Tax=Aureitalea marina TaxID=930804 RepID=A0A2S7KLR9_9FLAO|nr:hypothetical protein BST85_00725 [Aureitalea marina]
MKMAMPVCEDGEEDHDCCDNEYLDLVTDDHFNKSQWDLSLDVLDYVILPSQAFGQLAIQAEPSQEAIPHYRPPPPRLRQYIIYETFLI